MGGSSKETQQTQQVQQNTIDPEQKALLMGNYATAQGNAAKLNTPYGGLLTAGFNPTQTAAQGLFSGLASNPTYGTTANAATNGAMGVLGTPLNGKITPQTVNPSTIAGTDLSQYTNPYTSSVINATMGENERGREMQQVADQQHSTAAGAFGGARAGVADSLTNEAYDRNNLSAIAGLNQANYSQAQNAAGTDNAAKNAAAQFNSSQGVLGQQSTFANNLAGQNMTLNAANNVANLNNNALTMGTQQAGLLGSVGDVQQGQQQSELSNAYQNWLTGQNMTAQQQNILNSALGLMPTQQTVTSNGTDSATKSTTPGATDILGGIGSAGMGLGSMGLGFADVRRKVLQFDRSNSRLESFRYSPEVSDLQEAA
jgi:hypothetical protein